MTKILWWPWSGQWWPWSGLFLTHCNPDWNPSYWFKKQLEATQEGRSLGYSAKLPIITTFLWRRAVLNCRQSYLSPVLLPDVSQAGFRHIDPDCSGMATGPSWESLWIMATASSDWSFTFPTCRFKAHFLALAWLDLSAPAFSFSLILMPFVCFPRYFHIPLPPSFLHLWHIGFFPLIVPAFFRWYSEQNTGIGTLLFQDSTADP